jgi:hypothetical protein
MARLGRAGYPPHDRLVSGSRTSKPPAPTRRLGDDRRRFLMSGVVLLGLASMTTACVGFGPDAQPRPTVETALLGAIVAPTDGQGPPIECRGLAQDRCLHAGSVEGWVGGVDVVDVARVIVSCEGAPCTAVGGAMRIDLVLRDGSTVEVARGGYGEFDQP